MTRTAGIAGLALLALAATSEGIVSRDLVAGLAIALSIVALTASFLAYRQGREMQRSAQEYFARIENAARRLERDKVLNAQAPRSADAKPSRHGTAAANPAEPVNVPRLAQGLRPTVIEGGKAKAERLSAEMSAADDALLVALDAHALSVSLEPVVELQSSKVAAYRVHAHVVTADGASVHLRRLEGAHPGIDPAKFDVELFHAAAAASRRFPGGSTDETPLICPLGAATLGSPKDLRKIVGMMNNLPGLKSGLALELPAEALRHDDIVLSGAGLLADAGLRLGVEGVLAPQRRNEIAERFEIEFWSIAAGAPDHLAAIAGSICGEAKIIAAGLVDDHEVIAVIDAGVTLVCGPRFSEPKPVKAPGGALERDRISGIS